MPLEPVDYVDDLVPTNPLDTDDVDEGDDHIRNLKKAVQSALGGDAAGSQLKVAGVVVVDADTGGLVIVASEAGQGWCELALRDKTGGQGGLLKLDNAYLTLRNQQENQQVRLEVTKTGGDIDEVLRGTPGGDTEIFSQGVGRLAVTNNSVEIGDGVVSNFALDVLGGTTGDQGGQLWLRGSNGYLDCIIDNDAGDLRLFVNGAAQVALSAKPAGETRMNWNGQNALVTDDIVSGGGTGAQILDGGSAFRPVGFNVMPIADVGDPGGSTPFTKSRNGKTVRHNNLAAHVWPVISDPSVPQGAVWNILNGTSSPGGELTLDCAPGVFIRVYTGVDIEQTSSGGTVKVAPGSVATLQKYTDTIYHLWGNNIGATT